ncbi:MAG TPA: trypsin-like serine protease, partial [Bdellovibrionales bacterium]|nr:trypsin-like serine protease [Bdellovibrionales bacterium]
MKRIFKILLIASLPMICSFQSFGFSFSPNDVSTLKHQIVLNGNEAAAESDSAKFTAHLEILGPKDQQLGVCTGIIVEKDILLTAGHCFAIDGVEKVRVNFGVGGESGFSDSVDTTDYTFWHQKGSEFRNEYADIAQGYEG